MTTNICIINTGGTISCYHDPLEPMSAKEFGDAAQRLVDPIISERFPDTTLTYETALEFPESTTRTLDSTNLQPSDWCRMASFVLDNYDAYDGFVILHGTDSMDFTGSALPFLLNCVDERGIGTAVLSKPVIITGSQVPMFYQTPSSVTPNPSPLQLNFNTDAFQNFCGAVACARLGIPEVGVYFDSNLFRGNRVLKVNASEFRAFDSPNYPALATYGIELDLETTNMLPGPVDEGVSLSNPVARKEAQAQLAAVTASIDANPVMQFNAFPAAYSQTAGTAVIASLIDACVGQGIKGLVLESYGEGNFPSGNPDTPKSGAIYKALQRADAAGVVLLDATQVIAGTVNDAAYASGAWLPEAGALSSADMTPMAGFAKLTILLAAAAHNGWSNATIKQLLELNLQGEMLNVSRLDSRTDWELAPGQSISALDGSAILRNDPNAGVQLVTRKAVLWSPVPQPAPSLQRLIVRNDGDVVIYDDAYNVLWHSNTSTPAGASSQLALVGSAFAGAATPLSMRLYDYQNGTSTVLYQM